MCRTEWPGAPCGHAALTSAAVCHSCLLERGEALARELTAAYAALRDANQAWSFNGGQMHTHSWHDRADWRERNRAALSAAEASQ